MASSNHADLAAEMRARQRDAAEQLKKKSGARAPQARNASLRSAGRPEPIVWSSPALPDHGLGRHVRVLAGVSEEILDWVPSLRPQYTGLGSIVLITGCFAALAMLTAITKVVAVPVLMRLVIALLWGLAILLIDRWLMTSTHGLTMHHGSDTTKRKNAARRDAPEGRREARRRFAIFAPRIVLAVLVGLTIAEPVILFVFQSTLDRQVQTTQKDQLVSYESLLNTCNPPFGQPQPKNAACADYRLLVTVPPPTALQAQLAVAKTQAATDQATITSLQATVNSEKTLATNECAGTSGPGLTGLPGDSTDCNRDWRVADASQAQLNTDLNRLATDNASVVSLEQQLTTATNQYNNDLSTQIDQAINDKKNDQRGVIGIIDEWNALSQLSARNPVVTVASWLLRLIFIMLDCLPVLAKLIGGSTVYDGLLANRRQHDEKIFDYELCVLDHHEAAERELRIAEKDHLLAERRAALKQGDAVKMSPALARRLRAFAATIPGMTVPLVKNRLIDEALRIEEHPGIVFRGWRRRATVLDGRPVWEIIREVRSLTAENPDMPEDELLQIVAQQTETDSGGVRVARRYEQSYPAEIDAEIAAADAEDKARKRASRQFLG